LRILVISDIHGNADALRRVLEDSGRWDYLWVLGDLVDYGPEPHVVIDMVRELKPDVIVQGNHDHAVANGADCRCDPVVHELSVYTRENISMRLVSSEQRDWLRSLPLKQSVSISGRDYYIVHGSPLSPLYGYLKPDLSRAELLANMRENPFSKSIIKADYLVVGHTHIAFKLSVEGVTILNPGSIGQPRDGAPGASYLVIDPEENTYIHKRVKYDVETVIRKLQGLGIQEKYLDWLKKILYNATIQPCPE